MNTKSNKSVQKDWTFDSLEDRLVPATFQAVINITEVEQYAVELINRARANPAGEAARFGIALNEGVSSANQISTAAKQPLALNASLRTAVRGHLQDMYANQFFAHNGSNGSTPVERMAARGYTGWTGENLAWRGTTANNFNNVEFVEAMHRDLFVDTGIAGRGHRVSMLRDIYSEVGSAVVGGNFMGYNALMTGQNFGHRGDVFITGVAYSDTVNANNFFNVGEAVQSLTITATRSDGEEFYTRTGTSGGYSLKLEAGNYVVTASRELANGSTEIWTVNVNNFGAANTKVDFNLRTANSQIVSPNAPAPTAPAPTGSAQTVASVGDTIGVFGNNNTFYLRDSVSAGNPNVSSPFSLLPGKKVTPVAGDWNGDGIDTIGVFDHATGQWRLRDGNSAAAGNQAIFNFGAPNWVPVAGDWNGDGIDTIGVFDPTTGTWYLRNSNNAGAPDYTPFSFGAPGWIPVVGDWNGDGVDTIGVFNPHTGTWYLRNSNSAGSPDVAPFSYGAPGWTPVVGDWNGDGVDTIGVINTQTGTWYIRDANAAGSPDYAPFSYGAPGWTPVIGNWTGPVGSPLKAQTPATAAVGSVLTQSELDGMVRGALDRLSQAGVADDLVSQLASVQVVVGNLPGLLLGLAQTGSNTIVIDVNAAGHGWYVDATPENDDEFANDSTVEGMDLLTVVLHEMGHMIGLDDLDASIHADELMTESIGSGDRRVDALDSLFAENLLV